MSVYRQAAQGINATAAIILAIGFVIAMMGIQQWNVSRTGGKIFTFGIRVEASYAWKFYATMATFITLFAVGFSIVGNGVNMAFRKEEEPRRNA